MTHPDTIKKWGVLYNWYVIEPTNPKQIVPTGWRVPDTTDWNILENYLIANGYNWDGTTTGNKIAKSMAAKTDWDLYGIIGAVGCDLTINNSSGFSALPGGYRHLDGYFLYKSWFGGWWSATEINASFAWYRRLYYDTSDLRRYNLNKHFGISVRLLRDAK